MSRRPHKSINKYNSSIKKEIAPSSFLKRGEQLFRDGDVDGAIENFENELQQNPLNWEAWNYKGYCLLNKPDLENAKLCFEKALSIDKLQATTLCFLGAYYLRIQDFLTASEYYLNAQKLEGDELSFSHLAFYYYEIEEYTQSLEYVEKTLSLNQENESALNTKGLILIAQEDYVSAIKIFSHIVKRNLTNSVFIGNLGYAHLLNNDKEEAKKELELSISIDSNNSFALNNLGILYFKDEDYVNAWSSFHKATEIKPNIKKFWENKAECLLKLLISKETTFGSYHDVGCFLSKSELSIIDIIIGLNDLEPQLESADKEAVLLSLLKGDNFFNQTINDTKISLENYQKIYLSSLEIVSLLNTSNSIEELDFAHYTTLETTNALIFKNSPFRLHSVTTANDPKEGLPLLSFLGFSGMYYPNIYQAFIGSFTFNPDSLNQFRLYGKDNNMEGTGVSLLLSYEYFEENAALNKDLFNNNIQSIKTSKEPLFRCIYIDPLSKRVISLGHKEPCVFYRENMEYPSADIDIEVNNYLEYINGLKVQVQSALNALSSDIGTLFVEIGDNQMLRNELLKIIPLLLLHLRYLIKHSDFKEEQECRIIKVEPLINNNKILVSDDDNRMYINYLPVKVDNSLYVERVYWGPKTINFELFKDRVKCQGDNIRCYKNEHPFS